MKNILLFAFCCCVLSCKPTTTPPQNVSESKVNSTMVDTMSNTDKNEENLVSTSKITCDVQGEVGNTFEKQGVLVEERYNSDKQAKWLKISIPNQPCKIINIDYSSHRSYKLEDLDKDGYQDILEIALRTGPAYFRVYWFDTTQNDFIKIDKWFIGEGENEVIDISKSLFMGVSAYDNGGLYSDYNFSNTYTLFYFKKGIFRNLAEISFFISLQPYPDSKLSISVKKYKSAKDEEGTFVKTSFFNKLAPKADTLYKQRVLEQETYEHKLTTQLSQGQQDSLSNQYYEKIQLLPKEWTAMARPMVIQYWKKNLGIIVK